MQYYDTQMGKVTIYCDNKRALTQVFKTPTASITPFLSTDYDLIALSQKFLQLLPITYTYEWVKGHYKGTVKQCKHALNQTADKLASSHTRIILQI